MRDLTILTLNKKNIKDFAFERNELLKSVETEWILFIDTDEKISEELKEEINKAIKDKDFNGFYIKRKIYFCGTFAGEDKMLKLGRKTAGEWKRKVHEVWEIKGRVGILNSYIIHDTASNLSDYLNKVNFHSDLHAKENLIESKTSSLLKILIYPIANFVVCFFRSRNIVFSIMKSLHSYLSWTKLYFLQH